MSNGSAPKTVAQMAMRNVDNSKERKWYFRRSHFNADLDWSLVMDIVNSTDGYTAQIESDDLIKFFKQPGA